ncbi:MAG: PfkB family carbohydrate kinase [Planctomycetota bacterium]|jgi:sugar/nucleoside kinase (ribokinase family)
MSLLVTGSIGIDTVETPWGKVENALGGSSVYFAYAASFFTKVRLVGVIGNDCPDDFLKPLQDNPRIDMAGLEVRYGSKTFRWHGRYSEDVNERDTVAVELNVLGEAGATIPDQFLDSDYVFLANTHPYLQVEMLAQLTSPKLVVADTMDLWIKTERQALDSLLTKIDALVLNDSEAKLLTGTPNLVAAGLEIAKTVPKFVVIKKGEHGSLLLMDGRAYPLPGYPVANVVDPTGAGDTFAGGMMGYLAAKGKVDADTLRKALACGAVVASIELEDFSLNKLIAAAPADIEARMKEFRLMAAF